MSSDSPIHSPSHTHTHSFSDGHPLLIRTCISAKKCNAGTLLHNKPFIIGVTGGTASGKTTVCNEIRRKLGARSLALQMDRFYLTLPKGKSAAEHNFDVPAAFDWPLFQQTLEQLSKGQSVKVPKYSFERHEREEEWETFEHVDVIIVEGILVFHDKSIRDQFDLKVFVEADSDVRLSRRILRDIQERGRQLPGVVDQYLNTVKPAHEKYIQPTDRFADIIIPNNTNVNSFNDGNGVVAIDLLAQHINTELFKRGMVGRSGKNQTANFVDQTEDGKTIIVIDTKEALKKNEEEAEATN